MKRNQPEHIEQCKVISWRDEMVLTGVCPDLRWLHSIPNGGARHKATAGRLKAEGVVSGIADLFWPFKVHELPYDAKKAPLKWTCGLYIEMKVKPNKQSENQKEFQEFVESQDYQYSLCWSADEAIETIKEYGGIP